MNDDRSRLPLNHADLVKNSRGAGTYDHREAIIEIEHPDRVVVSVQYVRVAHPVLAGARRDDKIHAHATTS